MRKIRKAVQFRTYEDLAEEMKIISAEKGVTKEQLYEALLHFTVENKNDISILYDSSKARWYLKI